MKIAVILGTTRIGRQSEKVAKLLLEKLKAFPETEVNYLDIADFDFPVFEERLAYHPNPPEGVKSFSEHLKASEGIIFVIPEYNGNLPGVFKNAFDHFYTEYAHKAIGAVCVSDGKFGGIQASVNLNTLILRVNAFPSPSKLLVPNVTKAFDEQGKLVDESVGTHMEKFIKDYLWLAEAIIKQKERKPL